MAETCEIHGLGYGFIGHEPTPDVAGQQILCAQHYDSEVNADYVRIEPFQRHVISIYKSVLPVHAVSKVFAHRPERRYGNVGCEHQRSARSARGNGPIHGIKIPDLAVDSVSVGPIRGRNAPHTGRTVFTWHVHLRRIEMVGARSTSRVLEEIDETAVATVAEVHPRVRVLMCE